VSKVVATSWRPDDLIGLSGLAADRALKQFRLRVFAHAMTLLIGIFSLLSENSYFAYGCAAAAAITELSAWMFRRQGSALQEWSARARRHGMLADAFGRAVEPVDAADLAAAIHVALPTEEERAHYARFYSSEKPHGFDRLCEHIRESAFWSKHLYNDAAKNSLRSFLIFIAIAFLLALLAPLLQSTMPLYLPRALILVFAFLSSTDWLGDYLAFSSSSDQCDTIDRRLAQLPQSFDSLNPQSLAPMLLIFSDYVDAIGSAPLIPTGVYESSKAKLGELWIARQASLTNSSQTAEVVHEP
jgi:hypothetical protein